MLTLQQVAERAELSPETVRHYHKTATKARREGVATERDLPAPVGFIDNANAWDDAAVDAWLEVRKTPAKRGGLARSEMVAVLEAAEAGNIDHVITIARRNLK